MANFTTISLEINSGSTGSPVWRALGGAGTELRWSDQAGQTAVGSASWPAMIRPAATSQVTYTYAFTADTTGFIMYGGVWSKDNYLQARWNWDNVGTFASAPIFTAYIDTNHGAISRGDGSLLGGHTSDTGATARSYLKGNLYGRVDASGAPAAGPANGPTVTDGSTGSVNPTAGANWLTNFQSLQGDADYITFAATPAATTAGTISLEIALFTGPNMTPGTYTNQVSLKYTWT